MRSDGGIVLFQSPLPWGEGGISRFGEAKALEFRVRGYGQSLMPVSLRECGVVLSCGVCSSPSDRAYPLSRRVPRHPLPMGAGEKGRARALRSDRSDAAPAMTGEAE